MSDPSSNMRAVQIIASHKNLRSILEPALNVERDSIDWNSFGYSGQSGGVQTALSWAYCLFCDELPPKEWSYRDPFDGFFNLDRDIQVLVLQAMAIRHGFVKITVEDKPKSDFQTMVEGFGEQMAKDAKKERLKVVKGDNE